MIHRQTLRVLSALFLVLLLSPAKSQDIHFTLKHMAPLAFNPAQTGAFYGSYRLSGLYRDQYRSVIGSAAFMTPTFSIDVPVIRGFKKTDWVGVGLFFYSDKSGTGGLTQSSFKVSAAYHLALNKKGTSILSIAYQTGAIQRKVSDPTKLVFGDFLESNGMTNLDQGTADDMNKGFLDHVGGIRYSNKFNKTDEFFIGFSADKFGRPDWSVVTTGGNYRLYPRVFAQAGLSRVMSNKIKFSPNISFQKVLKAPENTIVLQGLFDYLYSKEKEIILKGGLGYRSGAGIGDAIQVMLGGELKGINVMLGYDVNISPLSGASGTVGGFELAAQYIGKVYKRPKPDPVIFCPRF
ncbi:MAG TPA: PorP/SprF family type IX secretion system membrane protein [Saprospiraceae bacterium]|nr:PorP/SprF family type IX secretion system membrane protein [Saprospiraceae bacterium]